MKKLKTLPIWCVVWNDASHPIGEWQKVEGDKPSSSKVMNIGHLISQNETMIKLAASVDYDDEDEPQHFSGEMSIPRACIVSIEVLHRQSIGNWAITQKKPRKARKQ